MIMSWPLNLSLASSKPFNKSPTTSQLFIEAQWYSELVTFLWLQVNSPMSLVTDYAAQSIALQSTSCKSITSIYFWNATASWPPGSSPYQVSEDLKEHMWVHLGLEVNLHSCLITASKCTSWFTQSWLSSIAPHLLGYSFQLLLHISSIMGCKCISECRHSPPSDISAMAQALPPASLDLWCLD